jgi:hypothetical protein
MVVDIINASIISIQDEARTLALYSNSNIIPPKSYIILGSSQKTIFHTDIDNPFRQKASFFSDEMKPEKPFKLSYFIGGKFRLYIPIIYNDSKINYDIELSIVGILHEGKEGFSEYLNRINQ